MNLWRDLPPGLDPPKQVYAIVKVASGGTNKYEYDIDLGVFRLDRVLYSAIYYPGDYRIIPRTWYIDKDPLDILAITTRPTFTGCVLAARPIGALTMEDEKGEDDKILAVPVGDPRFREVSEVDNLAHHLKSEIADFFLSYKHLEPSKWVKVKRWRDAKAAEAMIASAIKMYHDHFEAQR